MEDGKLPTDTLKILDLTSSKIKSIPAATKPVVAKNWGKWIFYFIDADTNKLKLPRTFTEEEKILIIESPTVNHADTFLFATDYCIAEDSTVLFINQQPQDSNDLNFIIRKDLRHNSVDTIFKSAEKIFNLSTDVSGEKMSFMIEPDSTVNSVKQHQLVLWQKGFGDLERIGEPGSPFLPQNWKISEHYQPFFSKDSTRLFFGIAPNPLIPDTTLLPDETVQVEVWHYMDDYLYTQKEMLLEEEKKKSFLIVHDYEKKNNFNLGSTDVPEIITAELGNGRFAIGINDQPYRHLQSWEGVEYEDLFSIDLNTGEVSIIGEKISGNPIISPLGNYVTWFNQVDTSWYLYNLSKKEKTNITQGNSSFADELNDEPEYPRSYGLAGWSDGDREFFIYDRYDIWKIDPENPSTKIRITNGRGDKTRYRYIKLQEDQIYIPNTIYLHAFNEESKKEAYYKLNLISGALSSLLKSEHKLSTRILKAKDSGDLVYTEESFIKFPDLMLTDTIFKYRATISNANPQQSQHRWGTIEQVQWKSSAGHVAEGLLVKPADFDPRKQYPMIVNFYERSSEGLHLHRSPAPHRSTINYSFYASNGYVVFNPDVSYQTGYPGESALEAVVSGTNHILSMGFVDSSRIALQGHSWGGYQIAYILTKTDIFKCAEAGAPVVNMTSAYGGIRWASGRSRMFQYERTQSRIGATLWDSTTLYIENSPLFYLDQMNTPVLILHNDEDGAVPWYQGIEYFVALRRLGKPAWMLNYNGEPHWPLKWQNRMDFNRRMFQFFEYYLKDKPMPTWMNRGVPPWEKGILQGFEYIDDEK